MRLPDVALRPRQGERPSRAVVRPTDLGLGAAAQEMAAWARAREATQRLEDEVQAAEDDRFAESVVTSLREGFEPRFAESGAAWDGVTPGYSRAALSAFDRLAGAIMEDPGRTPGQQAAVQRGLEAYRANVGQRAIAYEAQRSAARVAQERAAQEAVALGGAMAAFQREFGESYQGLIDDYDGATPGFADQVLAAHDAAAEAIVAGAPEHLQPALIQRLASDRLTRHAAALAVEREGAQSAIASQVEASGLELVNAIRSNPALYEGSGGQIDLIVAALPAHTRPAARRALQAEAAEARIAGLIRTGEHDQALAELNEGRHDAVLRNKEALLNRAISAQEAASAGDWVERLDLQDRVESDVASRTETGEGVAGVTVEEVARVLGPQAAARYMRAREEAERLHGVIGGWSRMSEAEIRAQVATLEPEPGDPDFAAKAQAHEIASRRMAAEIDRRARDPGGWAQGANPAVGELFAAVSAAETPAAARQAASTFGRASLEAQNAAGIAPALQRLLSAGQASAIVAAAENNPERSEGIAQLGGFIDAFGPPPGASAGTQRAANARQRMVIQQLHEAGADPEDLAAAVDLRDDPVRLGRYVAARRQDFAGRLDRRDRQQLEDRVRRELGDYLRSFQTVGPAPALTHGRVEMATRLAEHAMATRGVSASQAAREAAAVLEDRYSIVGVDSWRMPAHRAGQVIDGLRADVRVANALPLLNRDLSARDAAGFYTPADDGSGLSPAQRRERYADHVLARGRWATTADDGGLVLMAPTNDGGWSPALDAAGRPIARTWDELIERERRHRVRAPERPAPTPAAAASPAGGGRGQPRGVRNHNPGNLRPDGRSEWQGMAGVDEGPGGPFLRFRTPEHGLRALAIDMTTKAARGLDTLAEILPVYAPRRDGNDVGAYVRAVAARMGVRPDQTLDMSNEGVLAALVNAIAHHENGGDFYSAGQILAAARAALRRR